MRKPDDTHAATSQNLDKCVAAKNFLTRNEVTQRDVEPFRGRLAVHIQRLSIQKTVIKDKGVAQTPRQRNPYGRRTASSNEGHEELYSYLDEADGVGGMPWDGLTSISSTSKIRIEFGGIPR